MACRASVSASWHECVCINPASPRRASPRVRIGRGNSGHTTLGQTEGPSVPPSTSVQSVQDAGACGHQPRSPQSMSNPPGCNAARTRCSREQDAAARMEWVWDSGHHNARGQLQAPPAHPLWVQQLDSPPQAYSKARDHAGYVYHMACMSMAPRDAWVGEAGIQAWIMTCEALPGWLHARWWVGGNTHKGRGARE